MDVFEATALLQLAVIAVAAYAVYRIWSYLTNKGGTDCGPNGGQKCCDPSQISTDACVGADGTPCGFWEFWTATTCYQGTPSVTVAQQEQARQQSNAAGGVATVPIGTIAAPVPGVPGGYNTATGTIDPNAPNSGIPGTQPGSYTPAACYDFITGLPIDC